MSRKIRSIVLGNFVNQPGILRQFCYYNNWRLWSVTCRTLRKERPVLFSLLPETGKHNHDERSFIRLPVMDELGWFGDAKFQHLANLKMTASWHGDNKPVAGLFLSHQEWGNCIVTIRFDRQDGPTIQATTVDQVGEPIHFS